VKLLRLSSIALAALLIGAAPPSPRPTEGPAAERIHAHVEFLASDLLEGRDTGSPGHEIAANYVASQFRQLGLRPGGTNGSWFVRVPFRKATIKDTPKVSLKDKGRTTVLVVGRDVGLRPSLTDQRISVEAPMVFVGYGISDRRLGIDDYSNLDVRGKIAVGLGGPAPGIPSEIASHLGSAQAEVADPVSGVEPVGPDLGPVGEEGANEARARPARMNLPLGIAGVRQPAQRLVAAEETT